MSQDENTKVEIKFDDLPEDFQDLIREYIILIGFDVDLFSDEQQITIFNTATKDFFELVKNEFNKVSTEQMAKEIRMLEKSNWNPKMLDNSKDLLFYLNIAIANVINSLEYDLSNT